MANGCFFLGSDKAEFESAMPPAFITTFTTWQTSRRPYDNHYTFDTRTQARISWIFEELKKEFDHRARFYRIDRSKSEWPLTIADADKLWRQRLKFELLTEMLNKKTLAEAQEIVRQTLRTHAQDQSADYDGEGTLGAVFFLSINDASVRSLTPPISPPPLSRILAFR